MTQVDQPTVPSDDRLDDLDPAFVIPQEAARAHLAHWWREPLAGVLALSIGCFDAWHYGRDAGLSISLDELLILSGVVLIAGSRRLFGAAPPPPPPRQ